MAMFVAFDSNIWIKTNLLRTGLGPALLYGVGKSGAKLLLPSVVRTEASLKLLNDCLNASKLIDKNITLIRRIVGSAADFPMPDKGRIRAAIDHRFEELTTLTMELAPAITDYDAALSRVVEHRHPSSGEKEEFRDALILVNCTN